MNKPESYLSFKEIEFPSINRKITISELNESVKRAFPLIYDSMSRGKGLALGIIKYLYEHGESSMYRLKRGLNAELPAVRKILIRMEEKGYVEHRVEKGRGPRGKYLYSLSPMGGLVYHVVFTQKPYSWLIDYVLERLKGKEGFKEDFIAKFLEVNKGLIRNSAFEELMNYMIIKYLRISMEDLFKYIVLMLGRDIAKPYFATLIVTSAISSIPQILIGHTIMSTLGEEYTEDKLFYMLSTQYIKIPTLFPVTPSEEFYEDVIDVFEDLLEKKAISDLEVFKLVKTYIKYMIIPMQDVGLRNALAIMLKLAKQRNPNINIDDLSKRIENALETIEEIVKTL